MLVKLLFHVVEVTKLLPNLIKYQTLAFTNLDQVAINSDKNNFVRIIDNNIVGNKKSLTEHEKDEEISIDAEDEVAVTKEQIQNIKNEAEMLLQNAKKEADIIVKEAMSRVEEIEEYRKYTQTQKYVEEVAKEKLGLVNENEIVFKSE